MKKELKKKLLENYSKLFDPKCRPDLDCGDGWYELIDTLLSTISQMSLPDDFRISQIKQKYAGLEVYAWPKDDLIEELIHECHQASYGVCERCGSNSGVKFIVVQGWEQVACFPCRKMLKAGWHDGCAEFNDNEKLAAKALLKALEAKLEEELEHLFPGGNVQVVLRTKPESKGNPKNSHIVVRDAEGRVYAC